MPAPRFFRQPPKAGDPISRRGIAQGLARIEHALRTLAVLYGRVDWAGFEPTLVFDPSPGTGMEGQARELDVSVSGQTFTVATGELTLGQRKITYYGGTADGTSASAGDKRWVYAEVELATLACGAGLTADEHKAVDQMDSEYQIARFNLSQWIKTATGWTFIQYAHPALEQHGMLGG